MKKIFFYSFAFSVFCSFALFGQPLTGAKIIKASGGDYPTLASAFNAINTNGVSGNLTLFIDENLNELGTGLVLNRTDLTILNKVTIKPSSGKFPVVTISNFTLFGTIGQAFTINNTSNVIVDGSNVANGTSQDMTFVGNDNTASQAYLFGVINNSDNVTIKNLKLKSLSMPANSSGITFDGEITAGAGAADNFAVNNCIIGDSTKTFRNGIAVWGNTAATPAQGEIRNNNIYASRRGITTYFMKSNIYQGNTISIVTPDADQGFYAGIYLTGSVNPDLTIIEGNKITKIKMNTGATPKFCGGIVIYGNTGTFNIVNNFIAPNYENIGTNTANNIYGIVFGSATWNGAANIFHNTILISPDNSTGRHACVGYEMNSDAIMELKNNILINNNNSANSYVMHYPLLQSISNMLFANYNNLYTNNQLANIGYYGISACSTLASWKLATLQDSSSISKNVNFVSNSNLHLSSTSIGDVGLVCKYLTGVPIDIDGDIRNLNFPYMGADERPESQLPVELTSFSATSINHSGVVLNWTTQTELNNLSFEVERKSDANNWRTIGFVKGNGTATTKHNYQFTDINPIAGVVVYRLKQIDFTGNFNYTGEINVELKGASTFELSQNYPNPFNPETVIRYSLPKTAIVKITVFNTIGEQVAKIVDAIQEANFYQVKFSASALASGVYYYKIEANSTDGSESFNSIKKMLVLK